MRTFLIVSLLLVGTAGAAVGVFGLPPCCPFGKDAQTTGIAAAATPTAPGEAWTQTPCCPGHEAQPVAQQPAACDTAECPREDCEKGDAGCSAEKKAECERKRLAEKTAEGAKVQ